MPPGGWGCPAVLGMIGGCRGRPSVPAEVMASVITLQALHGLSDNATVDAVTFDLRWKAACGLPITEGAFHSTTLTYWRRRLADSERPNRIFEAVRAVVAATGVLAGRTRRALDSTVLDDAVATQDTVTQLIAAIRRVRREVSGAAEVVEGSDGTDGQWRSARQVASDRVISTVDPKVATCTSRCTTRRTAKASSPTSAESVVAQRVPTTPPDGGTFDSVADPRQPQSPLPRRREER